MRNVRPLITIVLTALALRWTVTSGAQSADAIVKIDTGTIEGAVPDDVLSFKGIP